MKKTVATVMLLAITLTPFASFAQDEKPKEAADQPKVEEKAAEERQAAKFPKELDTTEKQLSYIFGLKVGNSLKSLPTQIDLDIFLKGIKDILEDKEPLLTQEQASQVEKEFYVKAQEEHQKKMVETSEKNLKEGDAFLAENKAKEGVKTTESGLQYKVLKEGDGPIPTKEDKVKVHYKGTLMDGTVFDSSYDRGEPISFALKGVIPGWTEGVQLMKVGSKYQFVIPSKLGYGERGAGPKIGPNAVLVFEVELLGIEPASATKEPEVPGHEGEEH